MTLIICYALKCVCWLGLRLCLLQFAEGLRVKDMKLGELRFFLPWTVVCKKQQKMISTALDYYYTTPGVGSSRLWKRVGKSNASLF